MNLNDLASLSTAQNLLDLGQSDRTRSSTGSDAIGKALDLAGQRLEAQQSSTEVRLSAFSQLRSSVAQLQESSKALSDNENTNTPEEARAAAQNFINAFNNAQNTASQAVDGDKGTLSNDGRAVVAASQLSRTLNNSSTEQLRGIGITTNANGTLSIDQQRFTQALQNNPQQVGSALNEVGQQVQQSTSRQLNGNSAINRSIENLNNQARELDAQQAAQQQQADALRQQTENAPDTDSLNAIKASGIAAYQRIFSL